MFSVIIPLFNKELSVKTTIQSVLNQTFKDFEVIIVNDGSTDGSLEVVKQLEDLRIRIIDKPNGGVSSARNKGIEEAKYEWIVFLDADDLWEQKHLEVLSDMISKYKDDKVFTTSFIRSNQSKINKVNNNIEIIENYFKESMKRFVTWTSVICIHTDVFHKVGVFNVSLSRGEDLDLWARIGKQYRFIKSNSVTSIYRIEAENRSTRSFNLEQSRIFHYDFSKSSSDDETIYYKSQIIGLMRSFIRGGEWKLFYKLYKKFRKDLSFGEILKQ